MIKKILVCLAVFLSFSIQCSSADSWTNYRLEKHPEYIIAFPESFVVIHDGMTAQDLVGNPLGMTVEQARGNLAMNSAFMLAYSNDYSCTISIQDADNPDATDTDLLSEYDLNDLSDWLAEYTKAGMNAASGFSVNSIDNYIEETNHHKFIILAIDCNIGANRSLMIQANMMKNRKSIHITMGFNNYEDVDTDINTFFEVLKNFIVI